MRSLRDDGRQPSRGTSKLPFGHGESMLFGHADDVVVVRLDGVVSVTRHASAGEKVSATAVSHSGITDMRIMVETVVSRE
jgi:hypothetical protein